MSEPKIIEQPEARPVVACSDLLDDPTDDPAYQAFAWSMAKYCHCRANNCPCDGVLAGGPCDMVQEEEPERSYDEDE